MTNAIKIAHLTPHVIAVRLALEALHPRPTRWVICRIEDAGDYPGWETIAQHGNFVGLIAPARKDESSPPASSSGSPTPE